jgi:hypothetical protein
VFTKNLVEARRRVLKGQNKCQLPNHWASELGSEVTCRNEKHHENVEGAGGDSAHLSKLTRMQGKNC